MRPSDHHTDRGQSIAIIVIGILSFVFVILGCYMVFVPDPHAHTQWQTKRAISYITAATKENVPARAQAHIEAARRAILQTLSDAPYDPSLWIRFARIETLRDPASTQTIEQALQIALELKPSLRMQLQSEGLIDRE